MAVSTDPTRSTATTPWPHVTVGEDPMPALGFGTWQLEGSDCVDAVADALELGYRHIDTAQAYGNEEQVGEGLRRSGVDRDDVWITTKVWWEHLSHDDCLASARESLDRLGLDRVDLCLIHWPDDDVPMDEPLAALTRLRRGGAVGQIGVSNFTPSLLERAVARAPVACNQVEYHPFLAQDELLATARAHDVVITAYSPLARGRVMDDPVLGEIGRTHDKSPAQVALRWLLQQPGIAAIPRASVSNHRRANLEVFDFELDADEMARISDLDEGLRLVDPDFAPRWER